MRVPWRDSSSGAYLSGRTHTASSQQKAEYDARGPPPTTQQGVSKWSSAMSAIVVQLVFSMSCRRRLDEAAAVE